MCSHDLYMSTGDDGIAVKGTSSAMLFEYLTIESGLGLAIGSLTTDTVENITFRHAIIRNSIKGIYIKANWYDGEGATVQDVLYENITIIDALQFAVWIGPAQQMGNQDSCTLRWPQFKDSECMMSPAHTFTNITLRDVTIVDPYFSPGVIMGNESNPFTDLRFKNVTVVSWSRRSGQVDPSLRPWGLNYHCSGVSEATRWTATLAHPASTRIQTWRRLQPWLWGGGSVPCCGDPAVNIATHRRESERLHEYHTTHSYLA